MKKKILLTVLSAALVYTAVLFWLLKTNDFRPDRFIFAGDHFVNKAELSPVIDVLPNSYGYDGQFYYRLALDPFTTVKDSKGIIIDQPALRQQRIFYPLMVHFLSFGKDNYSDDLMVLVNFVSILALSVVGVLWARELGVGPLWGGFMVLYPGLIFSLSRNLTEIVATVFGLGALLFFKRKLYVWMAIFLILALFTRETTLIYLLGIGLVIFRDLIKRKKVLDQIIAVAVPLVSFVVWQIVLWRIWGEVPIFLDSQLNIGLPLKGLIEGISHWRSVDYYNFIELAFVGVTLVTALVTIKKSAAQASVKYSWLIGLLIFLIWGAVLWSEDVTFMRAFTELFFLSYLLILGSKRDVKLAYISVLSVLFMVVFYLRFV